jgi:hypothetical protein
MKENRKKSGGTWVAIVLVILLVVYPLSLGPAIMLVGASGRNPLLFTAFQCIYGPLSFMPRPVDDALQWWGETWDIYGEFH